MWRLAPSPIHSDFRAVTVPSKIISASLTRRSKVGGITVVAPLGATERARQATNRKERSSFISRIFWLERNALISHEFTKHLPAARDSRLIDRDRKLPRARRRRCYPIREQ